MGRGIEEYSGTEATRAQRLLLSIGGSLRMAQAQMSPAQFNLYLRGMALDKDTATDWLSSDGSIESITDRMMSYLLAHLSTRLGA